MNQTEARIQQELLEIWMQAVDPQKLGPANAIASEISAYTGEPVPVVLERMAHGKDELAQRWKDNRVDATNPDAVEAFYDNQFVEAYELADWHAGRTNGYFPLSYAYAAYLAGAKGLKSALDFGSGIGTGALCFLQAGCQVDCADVASELLRFTRDRIRGRGYEINAIWLREQQKPGARKYDLITCFDVMEHVIAPFDKLRELESYLKPGGYLVVNFMNDSSDADRPMHISSAPDWLAWIRRTRLVPQWSLFYYGTGAPVQVFKKESFGWWRNQVAAIVDATQRRREVVAR